MTLLLQLQSHLDVEKHLQHSQYKAYSDDYFHFSFMSIMFFRLLPFLLIFFLSACRGDTPDTWDFDPKQVFLEPVAHKVSYEIVNIIISKDTAGFITRLHSEARNIENIQHDVEKFMESVHYGSDVRLSHYNSIQTFDSKKFPKIPIIEIYRTEYEVVRSNGYAKLTLDITPYKEQCCIIKNWKIERTEYRPSEYYDFTFMDRNFQHYLFFALLLIIPAICLFSAFDCYKNTNIKRRKLWIFFTLLGFGVTYFDWATGTFYESFGIIHINLLGAGIVKYGPYQPWWIKISIPLGAILYWIGPGDFRKRLKGLKVSKKRSL